VAKLAATQLLCAPFANQPVLVAAVEPNHRNPRWACCFELINQLNSACTTVQHKLRQRFPGSTVNRVWPRSSKTSSARPDTSGIQSRPTRVAKHDAVFVARPLRGSISAARSWIRNVEIAKPVPISWVSPAPAPELRQTGNANPGPTEPSVA